MGNKRVVTASLPAELVDQLDVAVERIERTKSWAIRDALRNWLKEQSRRNAMASADLESERI